MSKPVSFVSLGPGYVDLITLKAFSHLTQSDVIFCPATKNKEGHIISRTSDLISDTGLRKYIRLFIVPMDEDRSEAIDVYKNIAEEIAGLAQRDTRVAVAVEGDAGIYASIHYIMDVLEEMEVPVCQVCGIPSFVAAGALAQMQMVEQEGRLVVVPGTVAAEELDNYLVTGHTVVVMKLSKCRQVVKEYMGKHQEYHYHYFENVSLPEREYYTDDISVLQTLDYPYFSLMIIHP